MESSWRRHSGVEVEMLMPLQGFDQRGEKGHEAFGADAVGRVPDQEQSVLDFWSILAWARTMRDIFPHFCMVEKPHRVLTIVSSRCSKGIKQLALLLDSLRLTVLRDYLLK